LNKTNGWRYSSMHFYTGHAVEVINQVNNLMTLISYDRSLGKLMSWCDHGGKGKSSYLMHVSCTTSISANIRFIIVVYIRLFRSTTM